MGGLALFTPQMLHTSGILDIERYAAQTKENPYTLLGLDGSASLKDARAAYHKMSRQWHPDKNPNCGQECDDKMSEITKAFELIKRKKAPSPEEATWENYFRDLGNDWMVVIEWLSQALK